MLLQGMHKLETNLSILIPFLVAVVADSVLINLCWFGAASPHMAACCRAHVSSLAAVQCKQLLRAVCCFGAVAAHCWLMHHTCLATPMSAPDHVFMASLRGGVCDRARRMYAQHVALFVNAQQWPWGLF